MASLGQSERWAPDAGRRDDSLTENSSFGSWWDSVIALSTALLPIWSAMASPPCSGGEAPCAHTPLSPVLIESL